MNFYRTKRKKQDVSLIPLINVIFLLLIFFMVAGTVEGIDIFEVDLPKSENGITKSSGQAIIYLNEDGRIAVNNDIVEEKNLKTIVNTLFIDNPKQKVTIKSDASVSAKKLILVMNMVENAGGIDVSLVTQSASGG